MFPFLRTMALVAAVVLPLHLCLRLFPRRRNGVSSPFLREVLLAVFVVFSAGLAFLLLETRPGNLSVALMLNTALARLQTGQGINMIPLGTIKAYGATGLNLWSLINLAGNVAMFIPIGLALPCLYRRWQSFVSIGLLSVGLPVCIETMQLFVGRTVDIDDVILNTTGILTGYLIYNILKAIAPRIQVLAIE